MEWLDPKGKVQVKSHLVTAHLLAEHGTDTKTKASLAAREAGDNDMYQCLAKATRQARRGLLYVYNQRVSLFNPFSHSSHQSTRWFLQHGIPEDRRPVLYESKVKPRCTHSRAARSRPFWSRPRKQRSPACPTSPFASTSPRTASPSSTS